MITLEFFSNHQPNISSKWWLILLFWIIVWCWKYTWTSSGHTVIHPSLNNRLRIYKYSSTVSNNILRSLQCNRFVGETVKLWDSISVVSTWNQVWICWWSLVREIWTTCCTKPGQLYVDKLKLVELSFDAFICSNLVWDRKSKKQSRELSWSLLHYQWQDIENRNIWTSTASVCFRVRADCHSSL